MTHTVLEDQVHLRRLSRHTCLSQEDQEDTCRRRSLITDTDLQEAREDTSSSVKELKKQGIKVLALVNSVFAEEIAEDFARKIYGENYIRLQDLAQLAQKVGDLLELEIGR